MNQIKFAGTSTKPGVSVGQFYLVDGVLHILSQSGYDSYGDILYCLVSLETGRPLDSNFEDNPAYLLSHNSKIELFTAPFEVIPGN
jgi:hypothetical protein